MYVSETLIVTTGLGVAGKAAPFPGTVARNVPLDACKVLGVTTHSSTREVHPLLRLNLTVSHCRTRLKGGSTIIEIHLSIFPDGKPREPVALSILDGRLSAMNSSNTYSHEELELMILGRHAHILETVRSASPEHRQRWHPIQLVLLGHAFSRCLKFGIGHRLVYNIETWHSRLVGGRSGAFGVIPHTTADSNEIANGSQPVFIDSAPEMEWIGVSTDVVELALSTALVRVDEEVHIFGTVVDVADIGLHLLQLIVFVATHEHHAVLELHRITISLPHVK